VTGRLLPLFPDGFLQGCPQFFFDVALLWQPRAPLRRRDAPALASWSWAAWHGDLDLSAWSDSHLVHSEEPLLVRNNRIVDWQKLRRTTSRAADGGLEAKEEWKPIQFTFHTPRQRFEDPSVAEMPWAWHDHHRDDGQGGEKQRYFTYDPDDRKNHMQDIKFRFPFPPFERLRNVDRDATDSHLLKGMLQVACLALDMRYLPSNPTSEATKAVEDAHLMNDSGDQVGWIRLNMYDERRPPHGTDCELVAISEGVLNAQYLSSDPTTWPPIAVVAKVSPTNRQDVYFVNVLWVEHDGDIAYRRALGQVVKSAWESVCAGEIEILLG
jgi:hypothetical protein